MKPIAAESSLMAVTLIWGATFIFTKIGLGYTSPAMFIILRFSLALLLALIFLGKYFFKIKKIDFLQGLALGAVFGIGFLLQTYGLQKTSVERSAFITGMTVPITPFVFWMLTRKSISVWSIVGVVIATAGLYIFTDPSFGNINPGDLLTLFSTVFWALYISFMDIFTKGKSGKAYTSQLVIMQFLVSAPIAMIALLIFEHNFAVTFSFPLIIGIAFNGILASFGVTFIHTSVQRYTSPVKAALIFSLEPVFASALAFFIFHSTVGIREVFGGIVLLSGVIISELGPFFSAKINKKSRYS